MLERMQIGWLLISHFRMPLVKRLAVLVFAAVLGVAGFGVAAAPQAELWARWQKHNADSAVVVNHSAWDAFLQSYLRVDDGGVNLLDYAAAAKNGKTQLKAYLNTLQQTKVSKLNRNEQRAFWINLYNALTADVVINHYPVSSIRDIDISPGLFADGPWAKKLAQVEGEQLSLDDIEHRILRPIWQDARLHYAVNCASIGCPNLMARAFTADNSEAMLEQGARDFINHRRGAMVGGGGLVVSSIYKWFAEDFGGDDAGIIRHLRQYADAPLADALADISEVADDDYDWRLNKP